MKWKRIEVPIYRCAVYFCLESDGAKVVEKVERLGFRLKKKDRKDIINPANAGVACKLRGGENGAFLLTVRSAKKTPDDTSLISHECQHIVDYIFKYIGDRKVASRVREVHVYLLEYLVSKALEFFWKK